MKSRCIEQVVSRKTAYLGFLLCSDQSAHQCHRRLVAEYLQPRWKDVSTQHLK